MKKKLLCMSVLLMSLSACESISPLRYGEKTYQPTMSAQEMAQSRQEIEAIEQLARDQTKEEMNNVADAIHKARGNTTLILH